jgi:RNA polymerase sigma-70 factor, ECF subfamily
LAKGPFLRGRNRRAALIKGAAMPRWDNARIVYISAAVRDPYLYMAEHVGATGVYNSPRTIMANPRITFEGFFFDHRDRLFSVLCVMCANRHDAEELAQDAFLKMWERWDTVSSLDDPVAYLHRIAINSFRKRLRRVEVARRLTGQSRESAPTTGEDVVLLHEALRSLTPRQRAALVLTELLGYSADEAAKELGVKPSTIGALKYQGRAALKEEVRIPDD